MVSTPASIDDLERVKQVLTLVSDKESMLETIGSLQMTLFENKAAIEALEQKIAQHEKLKAEVEAMDAKVSDKLARAASLDESIKADQKALSEKEESIKAFEKSIAERESILEKKEQEHSAFVMARSLDVDNKMAEAGRLAEEALAKAKEYEEKLSKLKQIAGL